MATTYDGVAANITPYATFAITEPSDGDAATAASVNSPGPFQHLADLGAFAAQIPIQPSLATSALPTPGTVGYGSGGGGGTNDYSLLWAYHAGTSNSKNLRFYYRTNDGAFAIVQNAIAGGGVWTADDATKPSAMWVFGGTLTPASDNSGFGFFWKATSSGGWYDAEPGVGAASWDTGFSFDNDMFDGFNFSGPPGNAGFAATGGSGDSAGGFFTGGLDNGPGTYTQGTGTGAGTYSIGGGSSGRGVYGQGGSPDGVGGYFRGEGTAPGALFFGGSSGGPGGAGNGEAGGDGWQGNGQGSGSGGVFTGGSTGEGVKGNGGSVSGHGGKFQGGPNTDGLLATGGSGSTNGVVGVGSGTGSGLQGSSPTGYGADLSGNATRAALRLEPLSTDPSSASEGDIYWNGTSHTLKVYDGSNWKTVTVS